MESSAPAALRDRMRVAVGCSSMMMVDAAPQAAADPPASQCLNDMLDSVLVTKNGSESGVGTA